LFFAGSVASFAHLSTVRHARCIEHGKLIHVAKTPHPLAERSTTALLRVLFATDTQAKPGEHAHCNLCPSSREQIDETADVPLPRANASGCSPLPRPGADAPNRVALYRLAPMNSPPA
jgi:hypothetical protein